MSDSSPDANNQGALQGIKVLDFGQMVSAPFCAKLFSDYGADVIKVESAQGDSLRRFASSPECLQKRPGDSAFFQYLNASKRSVIGQPDDAAVRELIASADLVIEDFDTGSAELAALDVDALRKQHPQLVVLSISAFGRSGPYANRPATEFTVQADCGATGMRWSHWRFYWCNLCCGGRCCCRIGRAAHRAWRAY